MPQRVAIGSMEKHKSRTAAPIGEVRSPGTLGTGVELAKRSPRQDSTSAQSTSRMGLHRPTLSRELVNEYWRCVVAAEPEAMRYLPEYRHLVTKQYGPLPATHSLRYVSQPGSLLRDDSHVSAQRDSEDANVAPFASDSAVDAGGKLPTLGTAGAAWKDWDLINGARRFKAIRTDPHFFIGLARMAQRDGDQAAARTFLMRVVELFSKPPRGSQRSATPTKLLTHVSSVSLPKVAVALEPASASQAAAPSRLPKLQLFEVATHASAGAGGTRNAASAAIARSGNQWNHGESRDSCSAPLTGFDGTGDHETLAQVHHELAVLCLSDGDFESCKAHLDECVSLNPLAADVFALRGECLERLGMPAAAFDEYTKSFSLTTPSVAQVLSCARCAADADMHDEAQALYIQAMQMAVDQLTSDSSATVPEKRQGNRRSQHATSHGRRGCSGNAGACLSECASGRELTRAATLPPLPSFPPLSLTSAHASVTVSPLPGKSLCSVISDLPLEKLSLLTESAGTGNAEQRQYIAYALFQLGLVVERRASRNACTTSGEGSLDQSTSVATAAAQDYFDKVQLINATFYEPYAVGAEQAVRNGELDTAIELFTSLTKLFPLDATYYLRIAAVYRMKGLSYAPEEVMSLSNALDRRQASEQQRQLALLRRGTLFADVFQRYDEAIADFNLCLSFDSAMPLAHLKRADTYAIRQLEPGDHDSAVNDYVSFVSYPKHSLIAALENCCFLWMSTLEPNAPHTQQSTFDGDEAPSCETFATACSGSVGSPWDLWSEALSIIGESGSAALRLLQSMRLQQQLQPSLTPLVMLASQSTEAALAPQPPTKARSPMSRSSRTEEERSVRGTDGFVQGSRLQPPRVQVQPPQAAAQRETVTADEVLQAMLVEPYIFLALHAEGHLKDYVQASRFFSMAMVCGWRAEPMSGAPLYERLLDQRSESDSTSNSLSANPDSSYAMHSATAMPPLRHHRDVDVKGKMWVAMAHAVLARHRTLAELLGEEPVTLEGVPGNVDQNLSQSAAPGAGNAASGRSVGGAGGGGSSRGKKEVDKPPLNLSPADFMVVDSMYCALRALEPTMHTALEYELLDLWEHVHNEVTKAREDVLALRQGKKVKGRR